MNNQDMPASPIFNNEAKPRMVVDKDSMSKIEKPAVGETKYEKAYWQVLSAMLTSGFSHHSPEELATEAIEATNAGFKALESK